MSTILAQATAQAVVAGPGSVGPFPLPAGSAGARMTLQRAGLPALAPLLTIRGMVSFDGGATFVEAGGGAMQGGDITLPNGTTVAASSVSFLWPGAAPTQLRIDVEAATSFTADYAVEAL